MLVSDQYGLNVPEAAFREVYLMKPDLSPMLGCAGNIKLSDFLFLSMIFRVFHSSFIIYGLNVPETVFRKVFL